ncbi:MAG: hypothetical protein HY860_02240 [Chlamydiales bacterium]|nr:hypothetical protein [Chlamydiales bacterium]
MKINSKILSIPPYISSSWDNITSLHLGSKEEKKVLIILLKNGTTLEIPHLDHASIVQIFAAHGDYLESSKKATVKGDVFSSMNLGFPLPIDPEMMGHLSDVIQDPTKLQRIEIPPEALGKFVDFLKAMGLDEKLIMPEGDFPSDSVFAQFKKLLSGEPEVKKEELEEVVSDADLHFKEWDIQQTGDKLYKVINPLDRAEEYQVFLGDTLGCTCGHNDCEHLKAVLRS